MPLHPHACTLSHGQSPLAFTTSALHRIGSFSHKTACFVCVCVALGRPSFQHTMSVRIILYATRDPAQRLKMPRAQGPLLLSARASMCSCAESLSTSTRPIIGARRSHWVALLPALISLMYVLYSALGVRAPRLRQVRRQRRERASDERGGEERDGSLLPSRNDGDDDKVHSVHPGLLGISLPKVLAPGLPPGRAYRPVVRDRGVWSTQPKSEHIPRTTARARTCRERGLRAI